MINLKKILLIILFIVVIFGAGYAIYAVFFKAEKPAEIAAPPTTEEKPTVPPTGGLPSAVEIERPAAAEAPLATGGAADIPAIENAPVVGANVAQSGEVNFYNASDGKFYKVNEDGSIEILSDKVFYNVTGVIWSPDSSQAILEYPDGSNILYNFKTQKQATLPKHWQEFDFSPDGNKIVAKSIGMDVNNRWLIVSDPDGTNALAVEQLGNIANLTQVDWSPNGQIIAFAKDTDNMGVTSQNILFIGLKGENFKSITVPGVNFEGKWSPTGSKILYSATSQASNYLPLLWIVDADLSNMGANRHSLGVNTWAKKCAFANDDALYCAIPQDLRRGSGLSPDIAKTSSDSIWKINLTTGQKTITIVPSTSMNINSLNVSKDGNYLYFVDGLTNTIRKIRLR